MMEAITPLMSESANIAAPETSSSTASFGNWFAQNIGDLNTAMINADNGLTQLATGETSNLHHVMLELQSAKLEFDLAVQIRNKVLEGYQEIMRMQI
jgi:flagellar hook-basal body complex protein FliE